MSRRIRGEGTVYPKGTGWEASAYLEGRRRSARGRTQREARDKLRSMQQRAADGDPITDDRLTVVENVEYWLSVKRKDILSYAHN